MENGTLFLIPTPLTDDPAVEVIPQYTLSVIRKLEHFIVEEVRTARRFLIRAGIQKKIDDLSFLLFNEHSDRNDFSQYFAPIILGFDVGLLSEAGMPCIADPGAEIVNYAHLCGIRVVPLPGSSSLLMALMASGLNGQQFAFNGYVPVDSDRRTRKIRELEKTSGEKHQSQILIETPYRNFQLFNTILKNCQDNTLLCIAVEITGKEGWVQTKTIAEWKKHSPDLQKKRVVFILGR